METAANGTHVVEQHSIEVDVSSLLISDLIFIEAMSEGKVKAKDMVAWLDRLVVGGASHLPLSDLKDIVQAIADHTRDQSTEKN